MTKFEKIILSIVSLYIVFIGLNHFGVFDKSADSPQETDTLIIEHVIDSSIKTGTGNISIGRNLILQSTPITGYRFNDSITGTQNFYIVDYPEDQNVCIGERAFVQTKNKNQCKRKHSN